MRRDTRMRCGERREADRRPAEQCDQHERADRDPGDEVKRLDVGQCVRFQTNLAGDDIGLTRTRLCRFDDECAPAAGRPRPASTVPRRTI